LATRGRVDGWGGAERLDILKEVDGETGELRQTGRHSGRGGQIRRRKNPTKNT